MGRAAGAHGVIPPFFVSKLARAEQVKVVVGRGRRRAVRRYFLDLPHQFEFDKYFIKGCVLGKRSAPPRAAVAEKLPSPVMPAIMRAWVAGEEPPEARA